MVPNYIFYLQMYQHPQSPNFHLQEHTREPTTLLIYSPYPSQPTPNALLVLSSSLNKPSVRILAPHRPMSTFYLMNLLHDNNHVGYPSALSWNSLLENNIVSTAFETAIRKPKYMNSYRLMSFILYPDQILEWAVHPQLMEFLATHHLLCRDKVRQDDQDTMRLPFGITSRIGRSKQQHLPICLTLLFLHGKSQHPIKPFPAGILKPISRLDSTNPFYSEVYQVSCKMQKGHTLAMSI